MPHILREFPQFVAEHDPKAADALLTKHEQKMARAAKAKELREEGERI